MIFEGEEFPFWSEDEKAWIVKETDVWIVAIVPTIFNDRIVLARSSEWGQFYTSGFCYDKGALALVSASIWDPETEQYPLHFKKIAYDGRDKSHAVGWCSAQYVCRWCLEEVQHLLENSAPEYWHYAWAGESTICSQCGSLRDNGGLYLIHPDNTPLLRYPRATLWREYS